MQVKEAENITPMQFILGFLPVVVAAFYTRLEIVK